MFRYSSRIPPQDGRGIVTGGVCQRHHTYSFPQPAGFSTVPGAAGEKYRQLLMRAMTAFSIQRVVQELYLPVVHRLSATISTAATALPETMMPYTPLIYASYATIFLKPFPGCLRVMLLQAMNRAHRATHRPRSISLPSWLLSWLGNHDSHHLSLLHSLIRLSFHRTQAAI